MGTIRCKNWEQQEEEVGGRVSDGSGSPVHLGITWTTWDHVGQKIKTTVPEQQQFSRKEVSSDPDKTKRCNDQDFPIYCQPEKHKLMIIRGLNTQKLAQQHKKLQNDICRHTCGHTCGTGVMTVWMDRCDIGSLLFITVMRREEHKGPERAQIPGNSFLASPAAEGSGVNGTEARHYMMRSSLRELWVAVWQAGCSLRVTGVKVTVRPSHTCPRPVLSLCSQIVLL
ncbi:hypothetical protein Bbelb_203300 [Branchiostoma belcheri]|nr:hypothetical protein Bbelb_203300 [Branchiostoma belcheri]